MKSLGKFLLIIGIFAGIVVLNMDTSVEVDSPVGNLWGGSKRVNNLGLMNEKQNYLIFSGVLALVGVILLVSAPKNSSSNKNNSSNKSSERKKELLFNKASKYYNKEDYSSSIAILNQILEIEPTENKVLFNLACCYSLQHNKKALITLQDAIKFGYNDFKKIREYNVLRWLRDQTEYPDFVANNYVIPSINTGQSIANDDMISKLERLAKLKNEGIITNDELEYQKRQIIGGS